MRLFLLPVSTRRTLIYCQKRQRDPLAKQSLIDRATEKANATWTDWEAAKGGWKRMVTGWGNVLLRRIPFEEWGLKTIPSLSAKKKAMEISQQEKVEVLYPESFMDADKVPGVLERLAVERQGLHKQRMIWSLVGAPLTLPFALIPVLPNFPGFYLLFRGWSHWKALRGAQHLEFLVKNNVTIPKSSSILNEMYAAGLMYPTRQASREAAAPSIQECEEVARSVKKKANDSNEEAMLLRGWNGKLLAEQFKLPDMEVEIERAVEQVEKALRIAEKEKTEKSSAESGTSMPFKADEKDVR